MKDAGFPRRSEGGAERWPTLAVVGLGLIGGSVAMAARRAGIAGRIVAVGRSRASLEEARAAGIIDEISTDLAGGLAAADLVVLCTPVDVLIHDLPAVMRAARPGAIVTDAGSTKTSIVAAAEAAPSAGAFFVGSHPMAGSDRTGWRAGRESLFDGASTFVAVTESTDFSAAGRVAHFWRALGSRVIMCSPRRHDELVAAVSHVPHLAAVALVELLGQSGEDPGLLRLIAGPGLRDTTRVAKGDPVLWEQICHQNSAAIAEALDQVGAAMREMAADLRAGDCGGLRQALDRAQGLRRQLDRGNGLASGE